MLNQPTILDKPIAEQSATCTQCHDGGKQLYWQGSAHESRNVGCTDCHSVHAFQSVSNQLKSATAMDTCFGCHADIKADTMKASHHPIREGKIGCGDCHNHTRHSDRQEHHCQLDQRAVL